MSTESLGMSCRNKFSAVPPLSAKRGDWNTAGAIANSNRTVSTYSWFMNASGQGARRILQPPPSVFHRRFVGYAAWQRPPMEDQAHGDGAIVERVLQVR